MSSKQDDISKEQFIQICAEYGFRVRKLIKTWQSNSIWYVAYIPNYNVAIAGYILKTSETSVCVQLDCLYDGPVYFNVRKTCQPTTIQRFKFFLGEINKTVKNHIVNMKISKIQEEDF